MHRKKLHKQILQEMLTFHRSNVWQNETEPLNLKQTRKIIYASITQNAYCSRDIYLQFVGLSYHLALFK